MQIMYFVANWQRPWLILQHHSGAYFNGNDLYAEGTRENATTGLAMARYWQNDNPDPRDGMAGYRKSDLSCSLEFSYKRIHQSSG